MEANGVDVDFVDRVEKLREGSERGQCVGAMPAVTSMTTPVEMV
jgi:hypothetical protein